MGMSFWYAAIFGIGTFIAASITRQDQNPTVIVIWLAVSALVYFPSLWLHPNRSCWQCGGSGRHTGWLFTYARRSCLACGGSGRRLRFGARMLGLTEQSPMTIRRNH